MSEDDYTRQRIEEALAELDRPKYEQARDNGYLNPPGFNFHTLAAQSGTTMEEVQRAAVAMEKENLILYAEGCRRRSRSVEVRR
jgi:hypothetical protein